ncbi:hypothetical protein ACWIUD_07465 [Helicobacter sp. 23-1044]
MKCAKWQRGGSRFGKLARKSQNLGIFSKQTRRICAMFRHCETCLQVVAIYFFLI